MSHVMRRAWIVFLPLIFIAVSTHASDAALRSPWDAAAVTVNDSAFTCPAPVPLPHDFATNSYLMDPQHSVPDPLLQEQHQQSVAGIEDFSRAVVKAADDFQTKGSRAAAECAASLLESAANQGALAGTMDGHQAIYTQGTNLGAWAIAFLKVRNSGAVTDEQSRKITAWLKKLAESNRDYYDARRRIRRPDDGYSLHLYWAGFAVAAAAVANNDHGLFQWAMEAYQQGADNIREDGTLPIEMDRGQLALRSHVRALAALVLLAEFGEVNGINLYAERNFAIGRLIARCVSGLEDPSYFEQKTGVTQVVEPELQPWAISWAKPYTHRFPNPKLSALLAKATRLNYTMLGGLPPA
jgi:poly(beta-D-mannuronate) lyase